MTAKRAGAALVAAVAVALAGVSSGVAANNSNQTGLVNVSLGDVNLLNNSNLAVAANIAATVCGVNVPIAVLANQAIAGGQTVTCNTLTSAGGPPLAISQSQSGSPASQPNAGGNNSNQSGLVNVSLGDVNVLNNTNVAVAANIAVTACGLNIPVAVLAQQIITGAQTYTCNTLTSTGTGPLLQITQSL